MTDTFDVGCRRCPGLAQFLDGVRVKHPDYYCRPVPPFGDPAARLLVVGLAPGMHGANRTGRPFTGDHAGLLLYETLFKFGFSTGSESLAATDDLRLTNARITNAVKCLPPANKPTGEEIRNCNGYLAEELRVHGNSTVILALGKVAHDAIVRARGEKLSAWKFVHGAVHRLPEGLTLVDSYHCSRYNTQTRRLTADMFRQVVREAATLAGLIPAGHE